MVKHYHIVLRKNWDYAKVSTRGKSYASHVGAKMSEMVGKLRTHLTTDLSKGKEASIWSLFPLLCDEEIQSAAVIDSQTATSIKIGPGRQYREVATATQG